MLATDYFHAIPESAIFTGVHMPGKAALMAFLAEQFCRIYDVDRGLCQTTLNEREALGSTGFGGGIAIPHGRINQFAAPVSIIVRLDQPVDYDAVDAQPVDLVWALLSPQNKGAEHLKALAYISRMLRGEALVNQLRGAQNSAAAYALVSEQLQQNAA